MAGAERTARSLSAEASWKNAQPGGRGSYPLSHGLTSHVTSFRGSGTGGLWVKRGQQRFTNEVPSASRGTSGVASQLLSPWELPKLLHLNPLGSESVSHSVVSDSVQPMDCSPPSSSVHGILQARILEWLPFPSPGDLPDPRITPGSPALQADSLPSEPPWKPWYLRTGPYLEIGFILKMWKS